MTDDAQAANRSGEFVQSLERGLAVIRAFDARHPSLTLSEVAKQTGLSRASARRFLHTLVELGYMTFDGRVFALRVKVLELGYAYLAGVSLPDIAQPHLKQLAETVGESASVAVLDEMDIVYVARFATYRIMAARIGVGTRFPAYATSMGRAILGASSTAEREAYLERVELKPITSRTITDVATLRSVLEESERHGWALVDQELEEGLRSLAVPVRRGGKVVAAVNVSAPVRRGHVEQLIAELLPAVRAAATEIERDLASAANSTY